MFSVLRPIGTYVRALLCASALTLASRATVAEELTIVIDKGIKSAIPIAVVPFAAVGDSINVDVGEVIRADLARSGQFTSLPPADMPSQPGTFSAVNFKDWRVLGRDDLVIGKILSGGDGGYVVEFRVIDVINAKQLLGFRIPTSAENMRLTAHHISDLIYETLLGRKGAFATRIAYVTVERVSKKSLDVPPAGRGRRGL